MAEGKQGIRTLATKDKAELFGHESIILDATKWTESGTTYSYDLGSDYSDRFAFVTFDTSKGTSAQKQAWEDAGITGSVSSSLLASSKPSVNIPIIIDWRAR